MKLIALVIKQYDEFFKNQIFNFSDEYKVSFDFETNELKIQTILKTFMESLFIIFYL